MPHEADESDSTMEGGEWNLLSLLDRYLESPPATRESLRELVRRDHPEHADLLPCLESLELLAISAGTCSQTSNNAAAMDEATLTGEPAGGSSAPPGSPSFPRQFGKYQLIAELGRGGEGVVFKARQEDLDRHVALKMILANHLASPRQVARFYDEARSAAGLTHRGIIGIHDVGDVHGQHFFTMDFVDGPNLSELLRGGPLSPDKAASVLAEVARAVHYLHEHGIIHRDLKPSNVLLDTNHRPLLSDFGLAKTVKQDSHSKTGAIVGTAQYMAPEQVACRPVTRRSDVYGLGAILYEMLTGRPPFQAETAMDTLMQVLEVDPTPPRKLRPAVPRSLELICLRCLEKNPDNRYATADELAEDLERFLRNEPLHVQPHSFWFLVRHWGRAQPVLVSHLAGIAATVLIVQVMYLLRPGEAALHHRVLGVLIGWGSVSLLLQLLLGLPRTERVARYVWSAADAGFLTCLLCLSRPPLGPLLVGYPLLVVASGLFFRERMVWFATLTVLLSYFALLMLRPEARVPDHPQYPVIFAAATAILGFIVAHQVRRVRALSRFFQSRLP